MMSWKSNTTRNLLFCSCPLFYLRALQVFCRVSQKPFLRKQYFFPLIIHVKEAWREDSCLLIPWQKRWHSDLQLFNHLLDSHLGDGCVCVDLGQAGWPCSSFSSTQFFWLSVLSSFYWQGLSFTYKPLPRRSGFHCKFMTINFEMVHVTLLI